VGSNPIPGTSSSRLQLTLVVGVPALQPGEGDAHEHLLSSIDLEDNPAAQASEALKDLGGLSKIDKLEGDSLVSQKELCDFARATAG
jgi:hypothetical protein